MKALVYQGPGKKALEERPMPAISAPTDAIVRVAKTTICGTDLHILKGDVATCAPGRILGHEGVGTIETALVQTARSDRLCWRLNWLRVGNGQAEERGGAVRGSPLRPRSYRPVRALASSIQAEPARPGGDDGRTRTVDGAYYD